MVAMSSRGPRGISTPPGSFGRAFALAVALLVAGLPASAGAKAKKKVKKADVEAPATSAPEAPGGGASDEDDEASRSPAPTVPPPDSAPADPAPRPEPDPAPGSAAEAEEAARAAALAASHAGPHGALGLAIIAGRGGAAFAARLAGAWPLRVAGLPGLAVGLALVGAYQRISIPTFGIDLRILGLSILPLAQYDLELRLAVPGRLSVLFEVGAGPSIVAQRIPDEPYYPAHYEYGVFFASHLAIGFRFLLANGILLEVDPIGIDLVSRPGYCDPSGICSGGGIGAAYELDVMIGYRFK